MSPGAQSYTYRNLILTATISVQTALCVMKEMNCNNFLHLLYGSHLSSALFEDKTKI